jgi:hypothetical protein
MEEVIIPAVAFLSLDETGKQKFYSVITNSRSYHFCDCQVASLGT